MFGLTPGQVDHTFRNLRRQGVQRAAPSMSSYQHLVNRAKEIVERNIEDESVRNRINRQLDKELTGNQLPDGPTFWALKKLVARCRDQKREFVETIRNFAQSKGISRNEAYRLFQQHYNEVGDNSLSNIYGDVFDSRTRQALSAMNDDPVNTSVIDTTPRITLDQTSSHRPDVTYGYDPDDGRLEVSMGTGANYVYRNVPAELYDRLDSNPLGVIGDLQNNHLYEYDSIEQQQGDAFGRWCTECHSYRAASGHVCEPIEESDTEMLMDTLEGATDQVAPEEVSLEAAQARILNALRDREQDNQIPSRPRARMTARRRTWVSALEGRAEVTLESDIRGRARGNSTYSAPDPQEVKRLALQGKVVVVNFERHSSSNSYARDFGVSPEVTMTYDMKFYCNDITGDVKMERVGTPRCNCLEYERSSTCRHVRSRDDANTVNRFLTRDTEDYYERVDPMAKMRQDALRGRFILTESSNRSANEVFNGLRITTNLPNQTTLRRAQQILSNGGSVQVTGDNFSAYVDNNIVSGRLKFEASPDNLGITAINELRCNRCGEDNCNHTTTLANYFSSKIFPEDAVLANSASRLQQLESVDSSDWQSNPDEVKEVIDKFSVGIDRSYTANLGQYLTDYREARQKVAAGESPLPYATENVTNGVCVPGQKAFGVEIEFDFDNSTRYQGDALDRIAREMYDEGLSEYPDMQRWHYNARTATPYSHWSLERDATVAGEIVSPILHDTPETWENLRKICDIVKRNGGVASLRAGQHVHMGTVNRSARRSIRRDPALAAKNANILHFYAANEDSIRRVQTDPNRRAHRNNSYCSPLAVDSIQNNLYNFRAGYVNLGGDHSSSVNFGFDDRIEFRGADASLDPAHIQAQVMLCAGIVSAAERGELDAGPSYEKLKHQRVGTNARRLTAIRLSDESQEMTDDEVIVSDASFRNFITSIFDSDHGRKMMVAIAANTPWQR